MEEWNIFHFLLFLDSVYPWAGTCWLCELVFCFCFLFFLTSVLEYNCFTMVCQFLLYSKVNQLYIYIYPHISSVLRLPPSNPPYPTPPIPPLCVVTKHQADLPVLCGCFPLAICFTFGSVYMSMPLSHFGPAYLPPPHFLRSILQQVCVFITVLALGSS